MTHQSPEHNSFEVELEHAEESLASSAPEFEPGVALEGPSTGAQIPVINPWIVAMVVTIGTFMEVLDTSIANVALPHIAGSLSASQDESTWVLTSYLVANAIILPISGWISTVFGRRNFYLLSVAFFTLFSAACGLAPTLGMLVVFRVLQGLAGGGLQPSVQAILADAFPGEKRGMAMAVYTVAILCAPVLGPTLGGWITDNYSWRWIFYINIPVGLACIIFSRVVLHDPPHLVAKRAELKRSPLKIDGIGLGLIAIGLACAEIVMDRGQELDWFGDTFICWAFGIAVVSLIAAVLWELYTDKPVVNLRLLKERNFAACCTMVLLIYTALYACTFLMPQFMQELMRYDATTAGIVVSPAGLVTMIEVPIVGWLLSKGTDARRLITCGILTMSAATWWLSLANLEVAKSNFIWPRVLQVLGIGMTTVPISTIMFRFLPADQTSNASGIYALVRNEGGSLGIAIASTMLQRSTQRHQTYLAANIPPDILEKTVGPHPGYETMAHLYQQIQRQASLLAYMDQYKLFTGILLCTLPLILVLKRPPKVVGKIELDAH